MPLSSLRALVSPVTSGVLGIGLVVVATASVAAQGATRAKSPPTSIRSAPRTRPRPPDGPPDLQGVWVNNTVTPFERPQELAGKEFFTVAELAVLKQRAARLFSGDGDHAPGDALFLALLQHPEEYRSPKPTGS